MWYRNMLLALVAAVALTTCGSPTLGAAACNSGILQLSVPSTLDPSNADCFYMPPTSNSIKAACGVALKVTVANDVVNVVPLSQESLQYSGPGPTGTVDFNCQEYKASGMLVMGSITDARIGLYDNLTGQLTTLTKTGPGQITLTPGTQYSYQGPTPTCKYNYTVTSGCVFGIQAPATPPACPSGYASTAGLGGAKYCAPCPPGTSSTGPNAAACALCPAGTHSPRLGGLCKKCDSPTDYAAQPGTIVCQTCDSYGNRYSDGKSCKTCPAGSYPDPATAGQCVKCAAGRKCCTVGAGPACPACKPGAKASAATSVFALESATPAACLATDAAAQCAAKVQVTVGAGCALQLSNLAGTPSGAALCTLTTSLGIGFKGAVPTAAELTYRAANQFGTDYSILQANATAPGGPYLDFRTPGKCTLRYRALTKPVAALLGAAPRPSPPGTCPRGQYRDTTTDTAPGPCLPCPPGTYASAPGACTPCKAGTYAAGYGNAACRRCPKYQTSKAGAPKCTYCSPDGGVSGQYSNGGACASCPTDTLNPYGAINKCLGMKAGSVCCAAGSCGEDPKCAGGLSSSSGTQATYDSLLKVVSATLRGCGKAPAFIKCFAKGYYAAWVTSSADVAVTLSLVNKACALDPRGPTDYLGTYAGATRAYVTGQLSSMASTEGYELLSSAAAGTVTMHPTPAYPQYTLPPVPRTTPACAVTFQLVAGNAFDLTGPPQPKCPAGTVPATAAGTAFCKACGSGTFESGGRCVDCPAGTYGPAKGLTKCTGCPRGRFCAAGSSSPQACDRGTYATSGGQEVCAVCPANTYSNTATGATRCLPCPKGQVSDKGASACHFPR